MSEIKQVQGAQQQVQAAQQQVQAAQQQAQAAQQQAQAAQQQAQAAQQQAQAAQQQAATFPVVAEIWNIFESTLLLQAKKLVEDIASNQKADPKVLWARVKSNIRLGLLDVDVPETGTECLHSSSTADGAIHQRCRSPCLLGFDACPQHIHTTNTMASIEEEPVDRVIDCNDQPHFIDLSRIARDKNGKPVGYVEDDGILYIFEKIAGSEPLGPIGPPGAFGP